MALGNMKHPEDNKITFLRLPKLFKALESYWLKRYPDSKVHGANMGPTWVLSAPDEPHVGPMNFVIWVHITENWELSCFDANFVITGSTGNFHNKWLKIGSVTTLGFQ